MRLGIRAAWHLIRRHETATKSTSSFTGAARELTYAVQKALIREKEDQKENDDWGTEISPYTRCPCMRGDASKEFTKAEDPYLFSSAHVTSLVHFLLFGRNHMLYWTPRPNNLNASSTNASETSRLVHFLDAVPCDKMQRRTRLMQFSTTTSLLRSTRIVENISSKPF